MTTFDSHKNFAFGAINTPPNPPTTGLTVTLFPGQGEFMPSPPFNATVWPANSQPTVSNAEIVRCTAIAGDILTIERAQEGTSARTIVSGDQIANTVTVKIVTDVESAINSEVTRATTAEALLGTRLPVIQSIASTATPEILSATTDWAEITGLATDITSVVIVGSPGDRQKLVVSIVDNGTIRGIAWGANFIGSGSAALPTSTVSGKEITVFFIFNHSREVWVCMAVDAIGY